MSAQLSGCICMMNMVKSGCKAGGTCKKQWCQIIYEVAFQPAVKYQSRQKIRRVENFSRCTENGVFFSAANCKKDTVFGAARNFQGTFYFITTLTSMV